ncbi:MAG: glycoside hydrolase family 28 protein, partial [Ktedonobacteraceae bacterium]|nr:glycoside hydrolase family 28 protein [Ktedonobacteraceae bacterium]
MTTKYPSDDYRSQHASTDEVQESHPLWTRRRVIQLGGAGLVSGLALSPLLTNGMQALAASHTAAPTTTGPLPWPEANAIVSQTTVPTFPNNMFLLTNYGGVGNGSTDNTAAFQKAIAACNAAGGGHVVVPAGRYVTGAIHLLSNVDLHLAAGSTILFSGDASKYPPVLTRYEGIECINHSPLIYAYGQTNIALTGSGTLDAAGTAPWNKGSNRAGLLDPLVAAGVPPQQRNVVGKLRVTYIEPYNCSNVLIQGITMSHARFWQLHPTLCTNVTIDSVTQVSPSMGNSDGCDPESCDHVVITNCTFNALDDTIAIKSGRDADGRRLHTPSQNIVIAHCKFASNDGMITCGSELSGGIQNVYAYDLTTFGKSVKYVLYVKSNSRRGGFAKNINIDTVHGSGVFGPIIFI